MLRRRFDRGRQAKNARGVRVGRERRDLVDGEASFCKRACLVEAGDGDASHPLKRLARFHDNAVFSGLADRRHYCGRGREGERAGAEHDHHRHAAHKRVGEVSAERPCAEERRDGQRERRRHEPRRPLVGDALYGGLSGLRLFDETDELLKRRVGVDLRHLDDDRAELVHRPRAHFVARRFIDRQRLACHHALVDGSLAFEDSAVHRDGLARAHLHAVADAYLGERYVLEEYSPGSALGAGHYISCRRRDERRELGEAFARAFERRKFERLAESHQKGDLSRREHLAYREA